MDDEVLLALQDRLTTMEQQKVVQIKRNAKDEPILGSHNRITIRCNGCNNRFTWVRVDSALDLESFLMDHFSWRLKIQNEKSECVDHSRRCFKCNRPICTTNECWLPFGFKRPTGKYYCFPCDNKARREHFAPIICDDIISNDDE